MRPLAQKVAVVLVAVCAGSAGLLFSQNQRTAPTIEGVSGTALLELNLTDLGRNKQSLSQWRGKVMVVNFWATWCAPCREEMPEFSRVSKAYAGKGVQFVGIGIDSVDNVQKFSKEVEISYPLLIGENEAMQAAATVGNDLMALPFTAILDRRGRVVQVKLGKMKERDLESAIEMALGKG